MYLQVHKPLKAAFQKITLLLQICAVFSFFDLCEHDLHETALIQ